MITADAIGKVEPIRKVEVKSKASGEILRLYVAVGDEVRPGNLLAEIDPRDVRNAFDQAKADLEVAETRFDISEAQLERSEDLMASGVISPQEHESRNLEFANSRATLIKAQTNMELAELRLEDVTIRAPIAGTILERNVEEGQVIQSGSQNVSSGTTLLVMANLDLIQVRTLLDESEMGEIVPNMTAVVKVDAYPNRTFVGVVDKIEPQAVVQQNVTLFPVIVRLDNASRLLRPGMNTEVGIEIAEVPDVLLIPNNAVVMPQDAVPAAMVLGLDADAIDMQSMFAGGRGRGGGYGARPEGARPAGANRGGEGGYARDAQGRSGAFRQSGDGTAVTQHRGGPTTAGPMRGARRAVAFVVGEDGAIEPRAVMTGWNDWDYTQVVSGLNEGDLVALIGLAQLQARQEEFLDRIRSRSSPLGSRGGMGPH
jgi:HlyD family secretion protein